MEILLSLLLASLLPLLAASPYTKDLGIVGILICFYMNKLCWKIALCNAALRFLCSIRKKWWVQRSRIVSTYQQFTRESKYLGLDPPSITLLPDVVPIASQQAIQETGVGIKCPLMHKYIISGTYDHKGGVLTSRDGIKITIPKDAIIKGDLVTFYTVVDLCGPFVHPLQNRTNLASPYYWIGVTGSYHFQRPVQVEFEHYAVVTDPSCYQLLSCKDDDESCTMQPVDYEFKLQGSLCTFQTYHFCSYCLHYKCMHEGKEPVTHKNRIGVFYLKPENYQSLSSFTVEIFSYTTSHCMFRLKELCKNNGMIIDTNYSDLFDASCDKNSKSFFTLEYDHDIYGWDIHHSRATNLMIETKKINFYNDYTEMKELFYLEELSLFPPRFILNVRNVEHRRTTKLCTNFTVTLYNNPKERKLLKAITLKLTVPISANVKDYSAGISNDPPLPTIGDHPCGINENEPEYINLIKYLDVVAPHWEDIAIYLGIPNEKIPVINIDHPYVQKRCKEMFRTWLERTKLPCWCHFIRALYKVELVSVAEKVTKTHLKLYESTSTASTDINEDSSKTTNNTIINLDDLMRYLNDIPSNDLIYFVTRLLPKETAVRVIRDIRHNGRNEELNHCQNVRKICEAFLKEENPSGAKVQRALKQANCGDLADYIEEIFL